MKRILIAVLVFAVLPGCVSTKTIKLEQQAVDAMAGKNIVSTASEKQSFAAMTAGKAMFAMVGAVAMISEGNRIVSEYNIEDPALYIGEHLVNDLARQHQLNVLSTGNIVPDKDIEALVSKHQEADYILDVRTINWSFAYFPTDWDHYRVIYSAKLRFINAKSSEQIAEGFCHRVPDKSGKSPSHSQLLANDAARLKAELKKAAEWCVGEFRANVFSG